MSQSRMTILDPSLRLRPIGDRCRGRQVDQVVPTGVTTITGDKDNNSRRLPRAQGVSNNHLQVAGKDEGQVAEAPGGSKDQKPELQVDPTTQVVLAGNLRREEQQAEVVGAVEGGGLKPEAVDLVDKLEVGRNLKEETEMDGGDHNKRVVGEDHSRVEEGEVLSHCHPTASDQLQCKATIPEVEHQLLPPPVRDGGGRAMDPDQGQEEEQIPVREQAGVDRNLREQDVRIPEPDREEAYPDLGTASEGRLPVIIGRNRRTPSTLWNMTPRFRIRAMATMTFHYFWPIHLKTLNHRINYTGFQ